MRTLVLGAGAIGGYFGGRLLEAGRDVTFLVREKRAEQLARTGLVIDSPLGNVRLEAAPIQRDQIREPFDLILLTCKAYDLDGALESIRPAVGSNTVILPLLNGIRHLDSLDREFGPEHVLGGTCAIAATLSSEGHILHLNNTQSLRFGERSEKSSARVEAIAELVAPAKMSARASDQILQDMWEKWVLLSSLAGITCLMRASIGAIVDAPFGHSAILQMLDESIAIASAHSYPPAAPFLDYVRKLLTEKGSTFTASMLRDIENGNRIESDHILGDLIARGEEKGVETKLLALAFCHLKAYERKRGFQIESPPRTQTPEL